MIGNRIKQLREEAGLKQEELAQKISVSPSAIGMYETNKREPNNEITIRLADFFNCSIDYLMGISNYKNTNDYYLNEPEDFYSITNDLILKYKDPAIFTLVDKTVNAMLQKKLLSDFEKKLFINDYLNNYDITEDIKKDLVSSILKMFKFARSFTPNDLKTLEKSNLYTNDGKTLNDDIKYKLNKLKSSNYYMCPVYGRISAGMPNWAEECIEGRIPIDPVLFDIVNPEEHFFLRVNGESMNKLIRNGAYALIHKQDVVENGDIAVVLVNGDEATLKKFTKQGDLVVLEPMSNDSSFTVQIYDKNTPIKILGKYIGKFEMNK